MLPQAVRLLLLVPVEAPRHDITRTVRAVRARNHHRATALRRLVDVLVHARRRLVHAEHGLEVGDWALHGAGCRIQLVVTERVDLWSFLALPRERLTVLGELL